MAFSDNRVLSVWGSPMPRNRKDAVMEYSYYLQQMRKFCGITLEEMSKGLGVTQSAYVNYESGRNLPKDLEGFHKKLKKVVRQRISETKKTSESSL